MVRRNRQEITDYGWVHEQDNQKVVRESSGDHVLANEKGWNTYEKIADNKCKPAVDWWASNQHYWKDVRAVWDELFATKQTLAFNMKVEDKVMFMRLFELGGNMPAEGYNSEKARQAIKDIIQLHLKGDLKLARN